MAEWELIADCAISSLEAPAALGVHRGTGTEGKESDGEEKARILFGEKWSIGGLSFRRASNFELRKGSSENHKT